MLRLLQESFPKSIVVDRRPKPSHGYRAAHVVVSVSQKLVEIQIRTALQQIWAELSEKLADVIDPAIKYGGGDEYLKQFLANASLTIAEHETNESRVLEMQREVGVVLSTVSLTEERRISIMVLQERLAAVQANLGMKRENALDVLREAVQVVEGFRE